MLLKRRTAYKFWISDLLNAELNLTEDNVRYFKIRDKEVVRVNLIAIAIAKYENAVANYASLVLDDGTGKITVKAWDDDVRLISNTNMGDVVLVIARLYEQNGSIFLRPEIIKKTGLEWLKARNNELKRLYNEPLPAKEPSIDVDEKKVEPSFVVREKVVNVLMAEEDAISVQDIIAKTKLKEEDVEKVIDELLREGEIYSPRAGFLKIV